MNFLSSFVAEKGWRSGENTRPKRVEQRRKAKTEDLKELSRF